MKSIEKLQKQVDELQAECEARGRALESNLKRIHELESECSECCYKQEFDNIEQRYMPLPLDADGVPIHVGDRLSHANKSEFVVNGITFYHNTWRVVTDLATLDDGFQMRWAKECRHVKPDPLIELLEEFAYKVCDTNVDSAEFERYAERIRELMEVDNG